MRRKLLETACEGITPRITGHGEKTMTKSSDVDRAPVHAFVMPHELQPLLLKCQTIRKLAYEAKSIAAEMVGASAQQELMQIERLADVVVARILDESGASCDRTKFGGRRRQTFASAVETSLDTTTD